jgi:hypothetical protein
MKNKFLSFLLALLFSLGLAAQDSRVASQSSDTWELAEPAGFSSVSEASKMAEQIVKAAGLKPNFEIREAKIPNAAAVIYSGRRYILYNPDFINRLTRVTGTKWSAVSVLAHEIGHHLNSKSYGSSGAKLATELEADEFSGYVLRKLGASLQESQVAMQALGNVRGSSTHPPRAYRLNSIAKGWEEAGGADGRNNGIARTNIPASPNYTQTILNSTNILAHIRFDADPGAEYYVTTQYNVVKLANEKLYKVGKLAKLDNRQFPYFIYDEQDNRVFVNASGAIVNSKGSNVGRLSVSRS